MNSKIWAKLDQSFFRSSWTLYSGFVTCVVILFIWKLALIINIPLTDDHVFLLSPTFSLKSGHFFRSEFAHPAFDPYLFPYLYSFVSLPFVVLEYNYVLSPFFLGATFILLVMVVTGIFLNKSGVRPNVIILILIVMPTNGYFWAGRTEIVASIFLILVALLLHDIRSYDLTRGTLLMVSVLLCGSFLLHPISGIFGFLFLALLLIDPHHFTKSIQRFLEISVVSALLIVATYGPAMLIDHKYLFDSYTRFLEGQVRSADLPIVFRYFLTASSLFLILIMMVTVDVTQTRSAIAKLRRLLQEFVMFLPVLIFLMLQGTSYYVTLTTAYLLWRISLYGKNRIVPWFTMIIVAFAPTFSHYLPTLQLLDNPKYVHNLHQAYETLEDELENTHSETRYWISPDLAILAIDYANTHLFSNLVLKYFSEPELHQGDVIFYTNVREAEWISRFLDTTLYDFEVTEMIPESSGFLELSSLLQVRSEDGIGLWRVIIKPK